MAAKKKSPQKAAHGMEAAVTEALRHFPELKRMSEAERAALVRQRIDGFIQALKEGWSMEDGEVYVTEARGREAVSHEEEEFMRGHPRLLPMSDNFKAWWRSQSKPKKKAGTR
jgi:hypothetical protein